LSTGDFILLVNNYHIIYKPLLLSKKFKRKKKCKRIAFVLLTFFSIRRSEKRERERERERERGREREGEKKNSR
jgi:uncharacterized protein YdaU (DUF1376 family)